jgi:hypothetical protein
MLANNTGRRLGYGDPALEFQPCIHRVDKQLIINK